MKERIKVDVNWDEFYRGLMMFIIKLILLNMIIGLFIIFIAVVIFFALF